VAGLTLSGDAAKVSLAGGATLLAFLSSGCSSCQGFWEAFGSGAVGDLPAGTRVVAVTKDGSRESPSRLLELAPDGLPVILSSAAWDDYSVPGNPYFVYVVDGRIQGEGMASQWPQLASMLRDAAYDSELAVRRYGGRGEERASTRRSRPRASARTTRACIPPVGPSRRTVREHGGCARGRGLRVRARRRRVLGVVALRRVDAREHHPAR
jgi:hypothetical protein